MLALKLWAYLERSSLPASLGSIMYADRPRDPFTGLTALVQVAAGA